MRRAVVVGSGSEIPPTRVDNHQLARIMDTSDEWIRERSGVEARHFVEEGVGTSDLGVAAARRALAQAGVEPAEVDLVIFATMTPDHYFPGSGALLQAKLGLRPVPCFDIRQQCVGFLFGLQLADAHVRALEHARTRTGALALNVGTGRGYSVLELVRAFEQASGRKVPHEVVARRPGDVAELWADPARAKQLLGWSASRGIEAMCADTWRWQCGNPDGYRCAG